MAFRRTAQRNPQPRNQNSVAVARTSLELLAPVVQQQYINALAVNGYDCLFYSVLQHGRRCSCTFAIDAAPPNDGVAPIFDDKGNGSIEFISSMLGNSTFSIDRYGKRKNLPESKTTKDATISYEDSKNRIDVIDNLKDTDLVNDRARQILPKTKKLANSNFPEDVVLIEGAEIEVNDDVGSGQNSSAACGVCFGTGYIGGFAIHKGFKNDLDASWNAVSMQGFTITKVTHPYVFESVDNTGFIEWTVTLPKGAFAVEAIRVFNSRIPLWSGFGLDIKNAEFSTYEQLNYVSLLRFCNGLPATIRLSIDNYPDVFTMTHISLQLLMSDIPTYFDYPHLSKTSDTSVLDAVDQIQLNVTPEVPLVKPYDVVYDRVFNKLWRVTSVEDFVDRLQNQHGTSCNARLIQENEALYQLMPRQNERSTRRYAKIFPKNGNPVRNFSQK